MRLGYLESTGRVVQREDLHRQHFTDAQKTEAGGTLLNSDEDASAIPTPKYLTKDL